ncbi:hypothetical protein [Clostridium sp. BJN0001]|uniref:hypothetical protein n=1 Tax=Clostridium sp. BJN0001 TaxID=2930219 RepID=UPI001FD0F032|nr:hypothetical protein [Clostridium sp. BJN0001]
MNLKKKIVALVAGAVSVFTLAGCSETTLNYVSEVNKISNFESYESEGTGKISVEAQGQNLNINVKANGYTSNDGNSYAKIKFEDPTGLINIPEIEAYMSDGTFYINKSYFTGIYSMNGQAVPDSLKNLDAQYIGIDSGVSAEMIKSMQLDPDALAEMMQTVFGKDSKFDLPFVQNGREFNLDMNSDEMVDFIVQAISDGTSNLDSINEKFGLNLKDEDIANAKEAITSDGYLAGISKVKEMIKGSSLKVKDTFTDDSYTEDLALTLNVKDIAKVTVDTTSKCTKCAKRHFELPKSVVKMTQEEFSKLMNENVEQTEAMAKIAA